MRKNCGVALDQAGRHVHVPDADARGVLREAEYLVALAQRTLHALACADVVEIDRQAVGARQDIDLDRRADDRRVGLDVEGFTGFKDAQVRRVGFGADPVREDVGRDLAQQFLAAPPPRPLRDLIDVDEA